MVSNALIYNCFSVYLLTECAVQLQGEVDDCSCKVESLDSLNNNKIYPRLQSLLSKNYFRYFKVS